MSTIHVSLPDDLRAFVEAEAAARGYDGLDEYVRDVLRAVWKQHAKTELEEKLIAASESGPPIEVTSDFWAALRKRVRERAGAAKA